MADQTKVRKIALDRINPDLRVQPRFRMSRDAIKRYARCYRTSPGTLPPLLLGKLAGEEKLIIIDGFHRFEAARLADLSSLPARIVETDLTQAQWMAVEENIKNGVPLKQVEKRLIFRRFVRAGKNVELDGSLMSSRALQRALPTVGTHQSMLTWMRDDFPKIHAQMVGRDEEEPEYEEATLRQAEDEVMDNMERAAVAYLAAIGKAREEARQEVILNAVASDVRRNLEGALGRELDGTRDVLEALREIADQELDHDADF